MSDPLPETFCIIPWFHRHTDEQGHHKLCCIAHGESNYLHDAKGERLHISQHLSDAEVLNSHGARAARAQMLRGEWPAACERCRDSEQASGESARKHLNSRFTAEQQLAAVQRTHADGMLEQPVVRYADIRLGNACNLTCRMCGPIASRLWAPIYNQVQPKSYRMPERELKIMGQNNWVKSESVSWLLEQCLPTVETLHFAGGEPLILPEMVEALEQCIQSGRAGEISLSYNTNLTVLPEKVTSLWRHFRSVQVLCSVDGFGRVTEYIRRPSHWSDIDRNLRLLDRNFDEWKISLAKISCTTQLYNILSLGELYEYLRNANFSHVSVLPNLSPLYYPGYLSIQALPPAAKDKARMLLQRELKIAAKLEPWKYTGQIGTIHATIALMDAEDKTDELDAFLEFCEASDRAFGDSWRDTCPELAAAIDACHRPKSRIAAGLLGRFRSS